MNSYPKSVTITTVNSEPLTANGYVPVNRYVIIIFIQCEFVHTDLRCDRLLYVRSILLPNFVMDNVLLRYTNNKSSRYDGKDYWESRSKIRREPGSKENLDEGKKSPSRVRSVKIELNNPLFRICR